jgi:hypothetical protein
MAITRGRWLRLVAAAVALLLWFPAWAAPSAADSKPAPYALIFGTVWGSGEHPLYGVHVKLRRVDEKKFRWEATSDHRGEFAIRVPAGRLDYVLVPDLKHAKDQSLPETQIHVESDERIDTGIHLDQ